jgi:hypothetical protein
MPTYEWMRNLQQPYIKLSEAFNAHESKKSHHNHIGVYIFTNFLVFDATLLRRLASMSRTLSVARPFSHVNSHAQLQSVTVVVEGRRPERSRIT